MSISSSRLVLIFLAGIFLAFHVILGQSWGFRSGQRFLWPFNWPLKSSICNLHKFIDHKKCRKTRTQFQPWYAKTCTVKMSPLFFLLLSKITFENCGNHFSRLSKCHFCNNILRLQIAQHNRGKKVHMKWTKMVKTCYKMDLEWKWTAKSLLWQKSFFERGCLNVTFAIIFYERRINCVTEVGFGMNVINLCQHDFWEHSWIS